MSRIALIAENSIEYVSTLLDIWNNGDCAVLLDWRIPFESAHQMMIEAGVKNCCIEEGLLKDKTIPNDNPIRFTTFSIADRIPHLLPDEIREKYHENKSHDEAVILYSSGTTGKSKGIILSHYAITTNADAILDYMQLGINDCLYIAKSLSHSSTLTGELLVSLRSNTDVVLAPTVVPPRFVLSRISEFSVTMLCLNPMLLQIYAEEYEKKKYDLRSLKTIYCSGAVLNDNTYAKIHKVFTEINIYNVYGLSETGPRVTAQTKDCSKGNSVGKPIKGVELVAVDETGCPVPDCERGIIHVNTPSRYSGYVSGVEKHSSLYKGWLNTGDVGYIDNNSELHIVDRIDDVMIVNAHKIYPRDIEHLILDDDKISSCAVSIFTYDSTEMIGCLYVSDTECAIDIVHRLKQSLMPYEIPKKFIRVVSIPRNERGKVDKKEVQRILSNYDKERM